VPAVFVSPYIERGTVFHTQLEHASFSATTRLLFAHNAAPLNERDAAVKTFEGVLNRAIPRSDSDCLKKIKGLKITKPKRPTQVGNGKLSEHQLSQVLVASRLDELLPADLTVLGKDTGFKNIQQINNEQKAVAYIRLVSERARAYWKES
jgi:hypothetical protein